MKTMLVTTADVVAMPTSDALRPHCMPRMQPATATMTPNTPALIRPPAQSVMLTAPAVWLKYSMKEMSSIAMPISRPPSMPTILA